MLSITATLPLTAEEAATLKSLLDGGPVVEAPAKAPKAAAPAPKAAPVAVVPDPEPEAEEDLLGGTPEAEARTTQDCVTLATKLLGEGRQADVKAQLTKAGVKRVSELTTQAQIDGFLAALEG